MNQLAEGGVLKKGQVVLIDTWWNVNQNLTANQKRPEYRFNRYMVECE